MKSISFWISLNFIPMGRIDNYPASEPMLARFIDAYMPGLAISSTHPEKSGNFRGKNRPGRNMFLPPILEEMEETKNWWNISILAHVASWLDTPKENLELWLVEIGKNNIYSNLSLDLYILCHFNDVSGKFTICYYHITILFRKYIKIRFTVLLSQLQNLGLHLKSIHLNIMTHCNFVQSAN